MKTHLIRALIVLATSAPASSFADRNINVDGDRSDWSGATTCFSEPRRDSTSIDLVQVCVENNNSTGTGGSLFGLFTAAEAIPRNVDTWFGFLVDKNKDGFFTSADELWVAFFRAKSKTPAASSLQVRDPISFSLRREYTNIATCGGSSGADGWKGILSDSENNEMVELGISYGCLGLSSGDDHRLIQMGSYPSSDTTQNSFYDGMNGTLTTAAPPADVQHVVALSGPNRNTLTWTHPSQHEGVLILRAVGVSPNAAPTKGTKYKADDSVGNAKVAYFDEGGSSQSTFVDTGLTNGVRYFYKVYNHHQVYTYASGNAPSSSGIFSEPTSGTSPSPLWCYNVGLPGVMQPMLDLGVGVFMASNSGAITANNADGTERFRPVQLNGPVQSRFLVVPLQGRTGTYILTGDQSGYAYAIDSKTGAIVWRGNGGNPIANRIQAQPAVQLYQYSNSTFQGIHSGRDLIFFASRNSSSTSNKVVALSSVDGSVVWTYEPGNLDIISGGMLVDRAQNRLWVASRSGGGSQPSLRVLSTLNGAVLASFSFGDIDHPIAWRSTRNEAVVTTNAGIVYAVDLTTLAQTWNYTTGKQSNYAFPTSDGFIASLSAGSVQRYRVDTSTNAVTTVWANPPTISSPTGVRVEYATQKVLVGDNAGALHQLNVATGALEKSVPASSLAMGTPTIDTSFPTKRLYVGGLDGRLCTFEVPF